ncbi:MAG: nucleotidyltransferase domain-containing protein [Prevotella sp.]|nr:nucleotidyltransferase domain-containing protein [Prevotella sp.]
MMYGLDQEELELMRHIFSETEGIEEVVLYGSRAKGTYKPFSDVDITLKGENLSDEDLTDVCYKLSESLLPYFYDVSLFRQLTSPTLIDHIKRRGKTIYKKKLQTA